jgi:hypothetical protein
MADLWRNTWLALGLMMGGLMGGALRLISAPQPAEVEPSAEEMASDASQRDGGPVIGISQAGTERGERRE